MEIELEINGQKARAKEGETIMQVATRMGLYIPHFCYHPKLSIAANCRMCLVEVEKSPKPLPACATIALDGMVARLDSPKAKEAQNSVKTLDCTRIKSQEKPTCSSFSWLASLLYSTYLPLLFGGCTGTGALGYESFRGLKVVAMTTNS